MQRFQRHPNIDVCVFAVDESMLDVTLISYTAVHEVQCDLALRSARLASKPLRFVTLLRRTNLGRLRKEKWLQVDRRFVFMGFRSIRADSR
jgi:hypothetical protein